MQLISIVWLKDALAAEELLISGANIDYIAVRVPPALYVVAGFGSACLIKDSFVCFAEAIGLLANEAHNCVGGRIYVILDIAVGADLMVARQFKRRKHCTRDVEVTAALCTLF